ncbi:MAG: mechanosensitive ion channel [Crocosphaera sp.]|nr:mechanosensitive ion channel [Crocosphaera sp.]
MDNEENIDEENPSIAIISQTEEWIPDRDKVVMIISNEDAKLIEDGKISTFTLANNYFLRIKEAVENYKPEEAWVTFDFGTFNGLLYRPYNWLFNRNKIQYGFDKEGHKKLFFFTRLYNSNYYNLYYRASSMSKDIKIAATFIRWYNLAFENLIILQNFKKNKKQIKFNKEIDLTLTFDKNQFDNLNLVQSKFVFNDYIKSIRSIIENILKSFKIIDYIVTFIIGAIIGSSIRILIIYLIRYFNRQNNEIKLISIYQFLLNFIIIPVLILLLLLLMFLEIFLYNNFIDSFIGIIFSSLQYFMLSIWLFFKNDLLEILPFFIVPTILSLVVLKGLQWVINQFLIINQKKVSSKSKQNKIINSLTIMISVLLGIMIISPKLPIFTGFSAFIIIILTLTSPALIGDLISGFILILGNIVNENNFIKTGDVMGKVEDQGLLVHKIRTTQNKIITISNIDILKNLVTNYSKTLIEDKNDRNDRLIIHISITLGYDVPWRKVEYILIETAKKTNNILQNPEPFVWQKSLDDFYITYQLNAYFDPFATQKNTDDDIGRIYYQTYSDLLANIQDNCRKYNIELLSPHYQVNRLTQDGESSVIPPF